MSICQHQRCQTEALSAAEALCIARGVRFTPHRRHVFDIIWQSHKAMTASDIMTKMENSQPPITYRALEFLKELGLIHYIASLNAYVGCLHPEDDQHVGHMLICVACKDVMELLPTKILKQLEKEALQAHFHPTQTHIEMLGTCQKCFTGAAVS